MQVTTSHHIDASEPDADGFHSYYYEYDIYRFTLDGTSLVARSYSDTPDMAAFLSCEENETTRMLDGPDLNSPLLAEAARFLRARGKSVLQRLTSQDGYVALNS